MVGNGAYASNPLRNPPNDAEDVAAALKDSGFEVTFVKDASLVVLEKAVNDFAARLKGADTGLFYYAGHGVAVDGMNYLIPVSPRIDDVASVKSRAVAVDVVVGKMEATGVRTTLVFLDSCRDNPFPGASRSGTRGLAVVAAPKTVNSLIAYATSPGDVAQDGTGRNGVFSGAFIKRLQEPGLEIKDLMMNVKSEVASLSGNKQQPRVDDGMKEPFYFVSMEMVTARARADRDKASSELATLEARIAARDRAIAAAKTASEKSALEIERQKVKALEVAKRIELENAKTAATRLEAEAAKRKADDEARRSMTATEAALAASLKTQAEERRMDYEKLTRSDDSLEAFLKEITSLESALAEIARRYAAAATQAESDIHKFYTAKTVDLDKAQPDPWESDADFKARIDKEKQALVSARGTEVAARKASLAMEQKANEKDLRDRLAKTERDLTAKTYTVKGTPVSVVYGTFDRDKKAWSVTVTSKDPNLPYTTTLLHDISQTADLKTTYTTVDTGIKANAFAGEMDYALARMAGSEKFLVSVREVRLRDLTTDMVVLNAKLNEGIGIISASAPDKRIFTGTLSVTSTPTGAQVEEESKLLGTTPFTVELKPGEYLLKASWPKTTLLPGQAIATIQVAGTTSIVISPTYTVGNGGPAGGRVFYDKGSYSDGWRYLEAAPSDQSTGIQWYNGANINTGATATGVGSGRANTSTIISKQEAGNYAAALCDKLVLGGFDDWFLPSRMSSTLCTPICGRLAEVVLGLPGIGVPRRTTATTRGDRASMTGISTTSTRTTSTVFVLRGLFNWGRRQKGRVLLAAGHCPLQESVGFRIFAGRRRVASGKKASIKRHTSDPIDEHFLRRGTPSTTKKRSQGRIFGLAPLTRS